MMKAFFTEPNVEINLFKFEINEIYLNFNLEIWSLII